MNTTDNKQHRLFDFLLGDNIKMLPENFLQYKKDGAWEHYTPIQLKEMAFGLANSLLAKGINGNEINIENKSKVGLICFSSPDWLVIDLAVQLTGAVLIPLYPNISSNELVTIFNEAQLEICFVENMELYEKLSSVQHSIPSLKEIYIINSTNTELSWKPLIQPYSSAIYDQVLIQANKVQDTDVCTIIYTSGTTGTPKGVMLSHKNAYSNMKATSDEVFEYLTLEENRSLSFLPLNHIYEKMAMYFYTYNGFTISFAESVDKVAENLREVKPYMFCAVPRLLEKVYEKIISIGETQTGLKRTIFFWAVKLANRYEFNQKSNLAYKLQLWLADKLIYKKWREALGGNVKAIIMGGGACQERLIRVFGAAGIKVVEGYGLTETSPIIAFNRTNDIRPGTVGKPLKSVQIKLLEDGEICCKGDNVMVGYFKRPEETEKVLKDGWFCTGDIGEMVDSKYLKITDRKKEMFKTSGGKYVVPQPIENKMKESFLIEQIMVVGDGQKFVSALIVPNFSGLADWCRKHSIPYVGKEIALKSENITKLYQSIIDRYNPLFNHVEQIKKFVLLPEEWTVDKGELTPSMKIKRKVIAKKHETDIAQLYGL
ncbi:AMP-dependent synthetase/ligase [Mangrovimonas xylaniphaga]|uniref:AMP-dependent synthetase/ligase n=1 Tax=Mangrovimonas xylaniphaga TaxID=1645915 RepID=UPI0006B4D2EE|nr:long-chain fatty acid--CoA ligase [Mangrovimonas xylaniphaga]